MLNICMCGVQDGYPHKADCPYPLFRGSKRAQKRWVHKRDLLRALLSLKEGLKPNTEILAPNKELDALLLAVCDLLKDACLARAALQNPESVLGGASVARTAVHVSIEAAQHALAPFRERCDALRGENTDQEDFVVLDRDASGKMRFRAEPRE